MLKIYTPSEWFKVFGGYPTLIIDDDGKIFSEKDYYNLMVRNPIGMVDFEKGEIYGSDWANYVVRTPVGYIKQRNDVAEIYNRLPGFTALPVLYVREGKVYSYDEYHRILGGNPSGYIKEEKPRPEKREQRSSSGGEGGAGILFVIGIAAFLMLGNAIENFWNSAKTVPVVPLFFLIAAIALPFKTTCRTLKQIGPDAKALEKARQTASTLAAVISVIPAIAAMFTIKNLMDTGLFAFAVALLFLFGSYFVVYIALRNAILLGKIKV